MQRSKILRSAILIVIVLAANFTLDRVTKYIAVENLKDKAPISFLSDTVVLRYTENTGAFLSLGADWPDLVKYPVLVILPILICFAVLGWMLLRPHSQTVIILASTIVAGGLGNLFDRLFNNFHVVDFLNFGIGNLRTGILNVADMSVTFGAIILLFYEIFRKKPEAKDGENPENKTKSENL